MASTQHHGSKVIHEDRDAVMAQMSEVLKVVPACRLLVGGLGRAQGEAPASLRGHGRGVGQPEFHRLSKKVQHWRPHLYLTVVC
jgi:hypothetical protein